MEKIQKRVNALKNVQLKLSDAELKLYEEISQLEAKYQSVFEPIYAEREQIVNGEREPTEEEAHWPYKDEPEDEEEVNGSQVKKLKTEGVAAEKGLPDFWLKCLQSTNLLGGMIQEHDEPILKHLRDIKVKLNTQKPYGYTIEFHFNENEYFANKVLSKSYELTTERDDKNPLSSDTTRLFKCVGTKVEWNEGKNVTLKVTKKKQTNKSNGQTKEVTKEEKQSSFFDLFDTHTQDGVKPSLKDVGKKDRNEDELDEQEELEHLFDLDFEIGQFIKDVLVPKALLYYTGELTEEGLDSMDEDDDDDEDDEDDEESGAEEAKN